MVGFRYFLSVGFGAGLASAWWAAALWGYASPDCMDSQGNTLRWLWVIPSFLTTALLLAVAAYLVERWDKE